MSETECKQSA